MSEDTTIQKTTDNAADGSGVARAVLLTEERENGVQTTIESTTIRRVVDSLGRDDVTVDDILSAPEYEKGASKEDLSDIVYEECDDSIRVPSDKGRRVTTRKCEVRYQVELTLSDTGLGQTETFYCMFDEKDEAEEFVERLRAYDTITFHEEGGPFLNLEWSGKYRHIPSPLVEQADIDDLPPDKLWELVRVGTGLTVASAILLWMTTAVPSVIGNNPVGLTLSILLGVGGLLSGFIGLFGVGALYPLFFKQPSLETRRQLDSREPQSVVSVEELRDHVDPVTPTTYTGVQVERQGDEIRITNDCTDAEWTIETENGVITDKEAKQLLSEADVHKLEQGHAKFRVEENVGGTQQLDADVWLASEDGEWRLLPPEE